MQFCKRKLLLEKNRSLFIRDDLFVGKFSIKELVLAYNEASSVIGTIRLKEETGRYGICEPKRK